MTPPDNIEAGELFAAMMAVPRPHRVVDNPRKLPGTNEPVGKIAIWPLTQEEQMASNAAADQYTKDLLKNAQKKDEANLGYEHTYTNETAVQVLYRACREPENLQRAFFPSPKLLRTVLTSDEVGVLFKLYIGVQNEVGPIISYLSDEEHEAWVRRLAEGASTLPFELLSLEAQRSLVSFMASRLYAYWTATDSAGSLADDSSIKNESDNESSSLSPSTE